MSILPKQNRATKCSSIRIGGAESPISSFYSRQSALDIYMRALSTLRGLRGAPEVPPLCRETQSLGQQMFELSCENATVGTNGLRSSLSACTAISILSTA